MAKCNLVWMIFNGMGFLTAIEGQAPILTPWFNRLLSVVHQGPKSLLTTGWKNVLTLTRLQKKTFLTYFSVKHLNNLTKKNVMEKVFICIYYSLGPIISQSFFFQQTPQFFKCSPLPNGWDFTSCRKYQNSYRYQKQYKRQEKKKK